MHNLSYNVIVCLPRFNLCRLNANVFGMITLPHVLVLVLVLVTQVLVLVLVLGKFFIPVLVLVLVLAPHVLVLVLVLEKKVLATALEMPSL